MRKFLSWLQSPFRARSAVSLPLPPGPIGELQRELTGYALEIAQNCRVRLDFSHESIQKVERVLSNVHREYVRTGSNEGLEGIALEFGAYIATTIQQTTGEGQMERDHPELGPNTFPFHFKDGTLFPYAWCAKRIFEGDGDNVWSKYCALVLHPLQHPATDS